MKKRCFLHIFGFIFEDILSLDISMKFHKKHQKYEIFYDLFS